MDAQLDTWQPPTKRKRRWLGPVLWLTCAGAAGGAGYYAWELRAQRSASEQRIAELEQESRSLSDALELHRAGKVELDTQLTTCREELDVEKDTAADTGTRLAVTETELTECRTHVSGLTEQKAKANALLADFNQLTERFRKMIDTGQLDVEFRRGQMLVRLPAKVLFPSGSATLSDEGKAALREVAAILKKMPRRRFTVAGHTDDQPLRGGEFASNWELSTARAVTVTEMFVESGVRPRNLVAAGYGQYAPVAKNTSAAGRHRNRRIEIILEPDLSKLPLEKLASKSERSGKRKRAGKGKVAKTGR